MVIHRLPIIAIFTQLFVTPFDISTGPGEFSAEAWIKPNTMSTFFSIIFSRYLTGSASTYDWAFLCSQNDTLSFVVTGGISVVGSTTSLIKRSIWNHVALTVSSNNVCLYNNGVCVATLIVGNIPFTSTYDFTIGGGITQPIWMTDIRIQKRVARSLNISASSSVPYTVPTQPLQATSFTQLLLRAQRNMLITNNQGANSPQTTLAGNVQMGG